MQIIFQDPFSSLSPRFTVHEIIEEGLKIHTPDATREERYERVLDTLLEVGLEEEMAFRFPHEFSGGQRQRIAIARAIVLQPKFLILDEPTSALDVTIQGQIIELLLDLQKKYQMTYMFISHDLRVVRALADYVAVMQHGRIVESGPAQKIFNSPEQEYTRTAVYRRAGIDWILFFCCRNELLICTMAAFIAGDIVLKKSKSPLHGAEIAAHGAGGFVIGFSAVAHLTHFLRKHR